MCSEYKQFSLPLSLTLLCSMFYDFTSHPLSVSVCCVYVGDGGDQVLLQHHGIVLHWHNVTTLQVLSRDLLRGRAAEWGGRVMELQTIITNYNVQRTAAASLVAAPWPRHKWICTDSDSELLKWFSLSDSCSLRAERPAAGGDNWEYSQIKTIRGRILPRCKLGRTLLAFHNLHATM